VWFEKMHFMLATNSMGKIAKVVGEAIGCLWHAINNSNLL
jgi:hypothetical protein